jgi:tartrate dehydrogenase/decarboxylase/D-malate dehydrogenase
LKSKTKKVSKHNIAVIMGDGIGKEVVPEGMRVLDAAGRRFGFTLHWEMLPWGCDYYLKTREMMPADGLEVLKKHDAIFLGAIGDPKVPDHVSVWGLLLPIRKEFRQYVNLRPVKHMHGIESPLREREPGGIDFCVVRENNEGEYTNVGGVVYAGTDQEIAVQESIFTRAGVERVIRFAFELAGKRGRKHVTSATKSNALTYTLTFWDKVLKSVSGEYPEIRTDQYHVDALAAALVLNPDRFDVIVASNLFGDILSDLGGAIAGSLGIAPSANLNPEREFPSMFEPVHGSAPDIAGKSIANPVGQILSGAMMMDHLGHSEAARVIESAVEKIMAENIKTPDLGGKASTQEVGKAVAEMVANP